MIINADGIKQNLAYLLTYTFNYKLGQTNNWKGLYTPYWSLSVEEQFYVFFPILVLCLKKFKKVLWLILISLVVVGYAQILLNIFNIQKYNYVGLLTNMSFLCLGAIGSLATEEKILPGNFFSNLYVEIFLLILLGFTLTSHNWNFKSLVLPFLNLYLVIKAASFSFKIKVLDRLFLNTKVIYVSRISYGIYLYHGIIIYFFTKYLFDPIWWKIPFNSFGWFFKIQYNAWIIKFPVVVLLTIFVAGLSFRYIEMPILKLKDKYFKYKTPKISLEEKYEPIIT